MLTERSTSHIKENFGIKRENLDLYLLSNCESIGKYNEGVHIPTTYSPFPVSIYGMIIGYF